jgi:hypothetical protein
MAWKGNKKNNPPNPKNENINRGEKRIGDIRSNSIRRDTDKQTDLKITLYDIDEVIINYLNIMDLSIIDGGDVVKVPIYYGSNEKWVASRKFGYIRDKQGKIQLPAMIIKRTNTENDDDIEVFHKYLKYPVIKKYSEKNKYTQFSAISNDFKKTQEVYNITMADHMVLTYNCIIWTEYHEQMNSIIEKIKFNTKDYWGSSKGFRFRTMVASFSHTVELQTDEDRIVKSEFDLTTHGYILPDSYKILDKMYPTTNKLFTPKKIVIGTEIVTSESELYPYNNHIEKWSNKSYPNLSQGELLKTTSKGWNPINTTNPQLSGIKVVYVSGKPSIESSSNVKWRMAPSNSSEYGEEGWLAFDNSFLYLYSGGEWKRTPINSFS